MTTLPFYLDYHGPLWNIHVTFHRDNFGILCEGWQKGSVACPLGVLSWSRRVPFAVTHRERVVSWGR
jgi:hypothetical protein